VGFTGLGFSLPRSQCWVVSALVSISQKSLPMKHGKPNPIHWVDHLFLNSTLWTGLGATLAVYALVRAIGWVIGGFAAS
jgi:hypothetical protein